MDLERNDDDRIDMPETAEDFLLAARAWATGLRSTTNMIYNAFGSDRRGEAQAAVEVADSARAQALAAVAVAQLAFEARHDQILDEIAAERAR